MSINKHEAFAEEITQGALDLAYGEVAHFTKTSLYDLLEKYQHLPEKSQRHHLKDFYIKKMNELSQQTEENLNAF
jgi:hypothetical protein